MNNKNFENINVPDYAICLNDILILQEKTDSKVVYLVLNSDDFSIKETRAYNYDRYVLDSMAIRKSNFNAIGKLFLEKKINKLQDRKKQMKDELKSLDVAIASCLSIFVDLEDKHGN